MADIVTQTYIAIKKLEMQNDVSSHSVKETLIGQATLR